MLAELDKVQKHTRTRNFDSLEEIEKKLNEANDFIKQMQRNTTIKFNPDALIDVTISAYTGGHFPNCYKGRPETTFLYFKRGLNKKTWTWYNCQRKDCIQSADYTGYSISIV